MRRNILLMQSVAVTALLALTTASNAAVDVIRNNNVNGSASAPVMVVANGNEATMTTANKMTKDGQADAAVNNVSLANKQVEQRDIKWDFVQVGFLFNVPKITQKVDVYGLKFGLPMCGGDSKVTGIETAVFAGATQRVIGLQACTFASISKHLTGVQFSIVNYCDDLDGIQVGVANFAVEEAMFQFGIFNHSKGEAFQFGLLNYIEGARVPFMIIFNYK
ncbi:hypothetical protein AAEX28_14360 [Lentisphaerota bacterium WC36G]|nr:hypothetical protein LJT99_01115 [Lentisphaerae bacterium WC36]